MDRFYVVQVRMHIQLIYTKISGININKALMEISKLIILKII